jgi:hypothetical protein
LCAWNKLLGKSTENFQLYIRQRSFAKPIVAKNDKNEQKHDMIEEDSKRHVCALDCLQKRTQTVKVADLVDEDNAA